MVHVPQHHRYEKRPDWNGVHHDGRKYYTCVFQSDQKQTL